MPRGMLKIWWRKWRWFFCTRWLSIRRWGICLVFFAVISLRLLWQCFAFQWFWDEWCLDLLMSQYPYACFVFFYQPIARAGIGAWTRACFISPWTVVPVTGNCFWILKPLQLISHICFYLYRVLHKWTWK